jgi:alkanesulfonate monooxygenase SsuD/methylene tetrahydromethanopterin reductase-like flavin-dependent oxidoreductase (luciferase family)
MLGIGAGYAKEEFLAYGYPFPSASLRLEQLDEALTLMKKMWTEDHPTFQGRYYSIRDATGNPRPVTAPHPPIIIGGTGRGLMEMAAKHASVFNLELPVGDIETARAKLAILEKACDRLGRNFREIEKSWGSYIYVVPNEKELKEKEKILAQVPNNSILAGTPAAVIEVIQKYIDIGVTYFTFRFEDLPDLRGLRLFAEKVIPTFK